MDNPFPLEESKPPYKYWAFISYSSKDRAWAKWVHDALEKYRLPVRLIDHPTPVGDPAPKRLKPMFWDRLEMAAHHDLGGLIENSVRGSRYLIVVCSPNAVQSPWVEKEIRMFQRLHGPERILCVIVGGRASLSAEDCCFPLPLRNPSPKAPDARKKGDGKTNAKLMLLASMLGVSFDVLYQREKRRRAQQLLWAGLISAVVLCVTAGLWNKARTESVRSRAEQSLRQRGEYLNDMASVRRLWDQGDAAGLVSILGKYEHPQADDPRSFEWRYWRNLLSQQTPPTKITAAGAGWLTVVFHPTEPWLLAVDAKKQCSVWDTGTNRERFKVPGAVKSAEFTQDGQFIVTLFGSAFDESQGRMGEETVRIWDARDGHAVSSFRPPFLTTCVAVSAQGNAIAMGGHGGEVSIAEFPSGKGIAKLNTLRRNPLNPSQQFNSEDHGMVTEVVWREDGHCFATGNEDGSVLIWSLEPNMQTMRYSHAELAKPHGGPVTGIAFSPDARSVVSQSCGVLDRYKNQMNDASAIAWTAATGEVLAQWNPHATAPFLPSGYGTSSLTTGGHVMEVLSLINGRFRPVFDEDGRRVLTTGELGVEAWDTLSGRRLGEVFRTESPVAAVALHRKLHLIALASGDTIWIAPANWRSARELITSPCLIYDFQLSEDGTLIALRNEAGRGFSSGAQVTYSRAEDHILTVLRTSDGKQVHPRKNILGNTGAPWFGSNSESVGLGCERFYVSTGEPLPNLNGQTQGRQKSVFVSRNGLLGILVSGHDVEAVDMKANTTAAWQQQPGKNVKAAVFDEARQRVALGLPEGAVEIRNAQNGTLEAQLTTNVGELTSLTFSPDGAMLAVGGQGRAVQVWDLNSRLPRFTLSGHRREISSLAFGPDGRILVSASGRVEIDSPDAGEVRIWDMIDGQLRTELPSDRHEIYPGIAISPDGNHIYAAACDTRSQPDDVMTKMDRKEGRLVPASTPSPPLSSRIIVWDAAPMGAR